MDRGRVLAFQFANGWVLVGHARDPHFLDQIRLAWFGIFFRLAFFTLDFGIVFGLGNILHGRFFF